MKHTPQITRRRILGAAAAVAAMYVDSPAPAQDVSWKLWVRYVTGGAPYRPSFASMFLDPVFAEMEFVPADLPLGSYTGYNPLSLIPSPQLAPVPAGSGGFGNAPPILADNPRDTPWIPSSQVKTGGRTLLPGDNPVFGVLVLNDQTDWPEAAREAIQQAVAAGRGFVVFHNALGDNQNWPWWREQVTGGQLVLQDQGSLKKSTITNGASLDVRPVGTHPITEAIGSFRLANEVAFKGMWQSTKITPLLEATGAASDRVVAWVGPNTNARVVCIQPGDASETHRNPVFRRFVRNAILWAGGRVG